MFGSGDISIFTIILLTSVGALLPFLTVCTTSYAKIAVVLFIVRNALGIQQTPPNLVLGGITIILTAYIMAPVAKQTYEIATDPRASYTSIAALERNVPEIIKPLKEFMLKQGNPEHRKFFNETTRKIWKDQTLGEVKDTDLVIVVPAFLITELTRAFEIAFLLYMPFLMIDLVVSTVLVAMGMSMMSPPVVSTPLKLLLFVMVDGWSRLLEGLVLSYALP